MEKNTCRHIPIIAMTAHAMKGDRELCIEAGMDAYVPKPISIENLAETIHRFAPHPALQPSESGKMAHQTPERIDREALMKEFDNDRDLLTESLHLFQEAYPEMLGEIRSAIKTQDGGSYTPSPCTQRACKQFSRRRRSLSAFELEKMGRALRQTNHADALCKTLEAEITALENSILEFVKEDNQ